MAEHQTIQVSGRRLSVKVFPINTDDTSQLHSSRPDCIPGRFQSFARAILPSFLVLIVLIAFAIIVGAIMYYTLGPKLPSLYLNSLSVSKLNTINSTLKANWDVNVTFKNMDFIWAIHFKKIEFVVFYQDSYRLSGSEAKPFNLTMKKASAVNVKLVGNNQWIWTKKVLEYIDRDWRNGMVSFNLVVRTAARFEGVWWLWWWEERTVEHSCLDLKVWFKDDMSAGMLVGGLPINCFLL